MHGDNKQFEKYFESIFEIVTPTNQGLIEGLMEKKEKDLSF